MARGCTKAILLERIAATSKDIATFYQQDFINYRGRTTDTDEYYTEIVAKWCCDNFALFHAIPQIVRESSYQTTSHDGVPATSDSNREEELIAMAMFRQGTLPPLGRVIDYQTPLKNKRSDHAGKIDVLSYDGTTLRILELKEPDSKETMLRCALEGYTYLKTVCTSKLLSDFCLPSDTVVKACPFVFHGGAQWQEMQEDRPQLKQLMKLLDSDPCYASKQDETYMVTEE